MGLAGLSLASRRCCSPGWGGRTRRGEAQLVKAVSLPTQPDLEGLGVCLCVDHTHRSSVFLLLLLHAPASCPSWKTAKGLAQGLRERSQFPLNPGTGDERLWGCYVSCYLSQEHRMAPGYGSSGQGFLI